MKKNQTDPINDFEERRKRRKKIWKQIFKTSVIAAAIFFVIGFVPPSLILLLNIDDPKFPKAMENLALAGVLLFIVTLLAFIILLYVIVGVVSLWRRRSRRIVAKTVQETHTETHLPEPLMPPEHNINSPTLLPISTEQEASSTTKAQNKPIKPYLIAIGITGFLYIIYYVGRAYYEGFYNALGVPNIFVRYDIQDYVYKGAQIDTILITLAFTAVLMGLLRTNFLKPHGKSNTIKADFLHKYWSVVLLGYLAFYGAALVIFAYFQVFRPDLVINPSFVISILMTCIITLGILIMILYLDQEFLLQIRNSKTKRWIFIVVATITLFISPFMGGEAWGAYKGQIKVNNLPQVELFASHKLNDDINWIPIDNFTYKSDQTLYLVGQTSEYIIVKNADNPSKIDILSPTDILSITVTKPGQPQ